jgi:glucosamine 6-phosphate synthetase-like amidotransferase/phosphosugar isomerase protein
MCGIVAFVGHKPANFAAMKLMSIINRERGKDGIGIFKNGIITKKVSASYQYDKREGDPLNYFTGYYLKQHKRNYTNVIFVHNRAASKGAKDEGNLHPFEYTVDGVRFVFMHNGTIDNTTELCKEYGLEEKDFTSDTHLMGHLISHGHHDVLTKYIGAAVFIWWRSDKKDSIFVWKGFSKCTSSIAEEERPLLCYAANEGIYFASLSEGLQCGLDINNSEEIVDIPNNKVFEIAKNKFNLLEEHDRSMVEKPKVVYNYSYEDEERRYYKNHNYYPAVTAKIEKDKNDDKVVVCTYNKAEKNPQHKAKNKVYYWKGLYYVNGHPASGQFRLNIYGEKVEDPNVDFSYFYKGLWLDSEKSMKELMLGTHDDKIALFTSWNELEVLKQYFNQHFVHMQWVSSSCLIMAIGKTIFASGTFEKIPWLSYYKYNIDLSKNQYKAEYNGKKDKVVKTTVQSEMDFTNVIKYGNDELLNYELEHETQQIREIFNMEMNKLIRNIQDLYTECLNLEVFNNPENDTETEKERKLMLKAMYHMTIDSNLVKEISENLLPF